MNEFLNQLRKARPDYATATDFEVASAFADGNNLDRAAVFSALGLKEPTFFGELKNAIPRSLGQSVQGIGQIAEDAGWENNPVKRYGQSVIERNPTQINSLGDIADYPLAALGSGVGNAAGFLLPSGAVGIAGKAYGLGRLGMGTVQTLTAAVPSYGGIREQQIAEGHNEPKDILAAATGAGAVGWIEQRFGLNKMLGLSGAEKTSAREFASKMGKTPFRTGAKDALRAGRAEGAEGIAQNPIEQISAYQDPTSAKSIEDTLFSGAMDVLGGLGLGGYGGVRSALHHNQVVDLLNTGALHDPSMSGDIRNLAGEYRAGQIDATQGVEAGDQWLENYRRAVELDRDVGELQSYRLPEEIAVDAVRQATNEGENLPLQEVINLTAGVHKAEKADRKGSVFNGPSGVFASGPDGIERELTNGELLALRAGEDITQKPVKQSKTAEKKLSQSATNFEKIVRDDVGKGAIPGDHPLVIEWDASNKTAGDARRIGKKYSEAILSVQKPAAETATARSVVDKLTKKQREYFDAVEEVAGTGEVEHDAAIARKLGISRQAVNERKKNAISAVLREIKARYGLDDAQARGKVNEYFASLRTVEAADVDTFGLSPDMQNNTTIGMDEVFGNDGAPNQMSIVDSAGKTTENRFADTTGNREGAEGTAILSAAGMLDNGWVKPFDGQVVGMNKAEAARRFNVEVENTKRKKRNDATYAFTTLLDEKEGIEGELIQSIENEFGKESVDMATDEWNDYAHIQSRDGVSTPAFYELDIAQQRQAIKLLNTWLSKSPRTKMGLYDLFDRVEYDYYGRAYLGSALGGHASGGSRQIGGKTSEDAPRIGTGTGAKAITGEERANSSGAGEGTTKTRAGAEDQTDPAVETERQVPSTDGGEEAEVARQWNKLSAAYGIATWKGLAESQKGALLDAFATGDQARVESAVYAVVRQLNGEEVDTGDTAQFSEDKSPLQAESSRWKQVVALVLGSGMPKGANVITMLDSTPAVLQILGVKNLPVRASTHLFDSTNNHGATRELIERVPEILADPSLVWIHTGRNGELSFAFLTDSYNSKGERLYVALQPHQDRPGGKTNLVATINGLPTFSLLRELRNGAAVYSGNVPADARAAMAQGRENNRESSDLRERMSRKYGLPGLKRTIATKSDLVKMIGEGKAKYAEGSAKNATTVDKIKSVIKSAFFSPARMDAVVSVLPTQAEAVNLGIPEVASASQNGSKIKGFTHNGKVYLIAENIAAGQELGVFLHEVGVHLGMEKLVGKANMQWLASKVEEWAKKDDGSVEARIAKQAVNRAKNSSSANKQEELIAYMVEGLVNEGITPQAAGMTQAHQWFRKLWAAAKVALRKLGFKNPDFSGRNLVDLTYGAAHLGLSGVQRENVDGINEPMQKVLVNGAVRPTVDSTGKPIHATVEGVRNFWEWWDAKVDASRLEGEDGATTERRFSHALDAQGRPRVLYHGTNTDVPAFDPSHPGKHDKGWLGKAAVYLATDTLLADTYANIKSGAGYSPVSDRPNGQNVMPIYTRAKNLLSLTPADKAQIKQFSQRRREQWTQAQIDAGYDGTVVDWGRGGLEIAVFDQKDVKSASGNNGEFSSGDSRISFSESAPIGVTPSEYVKFTEAQISEQVNRAKVTVKDVAKGLLHKVTFMHDLIEIAKKEGLKSADGFNELMGQKDAIRNRIEETVDRIMQRVSNLNNKEAVESFIRDSTVGQKWGFKPSWDKEAKVDAGMKVRFDALPKESQNVVMDVFAHGENMYSQMQTLAEQEVRNEYKPLIEEANEDKKAELRKAMDKAIRRVQRAMPKLQGPYAPLKRFGDHVVVAKTAAYLTAEAEDDQKAIDALTKSTNGVHYLVEFYDNAGAAAARAKQLEADGFAKVVASNRQKQFDGIDELPWQGIQKIKHALQAEDDIKNKASMQKLVTDLYLQMLAETSARKAEMSRKGTYGSGDMFRAFAAQGRSMAHYISHMSKSGEIAKQITAMKKEAHDGGEGTRDSRTRVLNEILARFNQGLEYRETPFADKMMRATSLWMLLTSPAYYLTNATQTYMVALPVLGGRFKGAAFPAITQAYRDVARFVGKMGHELNIEDLPISKAEKEMLVTLRDNGKLDITIAADLGRWAEGSADQGKVAQALQKMNRAVAKVEALNRITTALAAYRLSGGDTKYAGKVVDETQGNYAGNNAPRFFAATGAHKVLTQFRKYQLIQLSLIGKLLHGAFKGSSKEEREVARRAFLWMFAQQIAFTGVKGAPIPAVLLMLAGALGGDDDKDWERNLRKLSDDKDVGLLLARGIPAWMGVDLSGRIGMGNAFSILPFADIPQDQSSYEKAVTAALGPTIGGIGTSVARGIDQIRHGNYYRGVEQMSPKLIKDGLAGYRTATEGITDKRGTVQMSPEDVGFFNGFMQAVGLPTTKVTEFNQLRGDLLETGKHFSDKFDALKESYAKGGDKEDIRQQWVETQEAARRWTEEMKKRGVGDKKLLEEMKPQPLSNLFKASAKKLEREREWRSVAH